MSAIAAVKGKGLRRRRSEYVYAALSRRGRVVAVCRDLNRRQAARFVNEARRRRLEIEYLPRNEV